MLGRMFNNGKRFAFIIFLISLAFNLGVEDVALLSGDEMNARSSFLVFLNGSLLGVTCTFVNGCYSPSSSQSLWIFGSHQRIIEAFRKMRRGGQLSEFVSIYKNDRQRSLFIASDAGRVCRFDFEFSENVLM